jgi:hypothetical protein
MSSRIARHFVDGCALSGLHSLRSFIDGCALSGLHSLRSFIDGCALSGLHSLRSFVSVIALLIFTTNLFGAEECDRACLRTMLDQYLNALIKHDPAAAPLLIGFRQTENATVVKLGSGLWKTATGLGKVQRRYFDPVSGQAAYFGFIEESGAPAIVTLRLKVDNKKVSEAEWVISRKGDPGLNGPGGNNLFDPENLIANPPPDRPLPKERRMSRDSMIAVTNSYFDGLTTHDGSIIQAIAGCPRIENGVTMTGRGAAPRGGAPAGERDCTSGLETINIQNVAARRFPVADEEAGVVLAMAVFIRKPGTTTRRNMFGEWFVLENNKIRSIYATLFYPAPEMPVPNWPPYDGNWPLK